jgi:uncharacterized protein (DUF1499 family)
VFQLVLPLHECPDPVAAKSAADEFAVEPLHSITDSTAAEHLQSVADSATAGVASTETS